MATFIIIFTLLALTFDAFYIAWFSNALSKKMYNKSIVLLPFTFAITRLLMFLFGYLLGLLTINIFNFQIELVIYPIFIVIGLKMIMESIAFNIEKTILINNYKELILLSLANSFNTFFIGINFGVIGSSLVLVLFTCFSSVMLICNLGLYLGKKFSYRGNVKYFGFIGGVVIITIVAYLIICNKI